VLGHLEQQGILSAADVASLKQMINDAEAQNPIADLQ
jgi:hypothetical protein